MGSANFSSQGSGNLRRRVIEYMGGEGDDADSATCGYITRCDRGEPYSPEHLHPPTAVDRLIDRGHDLARLLYDRRSMLVHLDVEYVDFNDPLAGKSTSVIAEKLHISARTVDPQCGHIREKLGLPGSAEVTRYAVRWVESGRLE